jgi:GH15 family glucan-1,4-alpha-glucosidase
MLPTVEFIAWDDERMIRTADAVRDKLGQDGLIRRYKTPDGIGDREGPFIACSFWLAECLAHQRRLDDAREVFDRAVAASNDLGLFSEEYDPAADTMLGNFPQGLTHLSHIAAAVVLLDDSQAADD